MHWGLPVKFMSFSDILARYGNKGITKFELTSEDKAPVSCDTQLALFSANCLWGSREVIRAA